MIERRALIYVALFMFLLSACGRDAAGEPTPEPAFITGLAPVNEIEIQTLAGAPVGVQVVARGAFVDGCTTIDHISVDRQERAFTVIIASTRPAEVACPDVINAFERIIPLDVVDLPAGNYTVQVNQISDVFELQVDNLQETPTPADDASASISGVVWHDVCGISGGEGGEPVAASDGCISTNAGGYQANGLRDLDEPGLGGVRVVLGRGACPVSQVATAVTLSDGNYSFTGLTSGTYCVSVDPLDSSNEPILIPGGWTAPPEGSGSLEVTLGIGERRTGANFGWDFQFLPVLNAQGCVDRAGFVADITAPDNVLVLPGASFTKTWRLRNAGTCTWGPGYFLIFVSGERMGGEPVPVPVAPPGAELDLSVSLTAPESRGSYRADWQLQNADREFFGFGNEFAQTVFVAIQVDPQAPEGSAIRGLVWSDRCVMLDETTPSQGCVSAEQGGYQGDGMLAEEEAFIPGVQVNLYAGACPAGGQPLETSLTAEDGDYEFAGLQAGTYCVQVDPAAAANTAVLGPGRFTYPEGDPGSTTVLVADNEIRLFVAFGWDFAQDK